MLRVVFLRWGISFRMKKIICFLLHYQPFVAFILISLVGVSSSSHTYTCQTNHLETLTLSGAILAWRPSICVVGISHELSPAICLKSWVTCPSNLEIVLFLWFFGVNKSCLSWICEIIMSCLPICLEIVLFTCRSLLR